ncbi:MAG TPA: aminotransferase class I/II-fold pyridoxal phosphate-dependent enzyme, partial [Polyangiaceae bacterium LLY-WYZ-15_(1-7)]|nr:aminotransferase class I/II-fold pyridoxal phosphate-dependent enzyme [Polyangiaceae bacterium LLY-WYZ-15_(1-7)]
IEEQLRAIVRERAVLRGALEAIEGLHVWPSDANFLLVRVPGDAVALRERLWAEGIAVRVFASHPRLAGHLRLTVGTPDENAALVDALRRAL